MQTIGLSQNELDFPSYCQARRQLVESKLTDYFAHDEANVLNEAMRYSVLAGGKRLRALLCLASAEAINGLESNLELVLPLSCAIEMIHAMSLIHDDLPALDNDDYRRGKLTNHKVYGEATALLAGDALLMLAIETVIEKTPLSVERQVLLNVVSRFCQATGASGMVGGQMLDLSFTGKVKELKSKSNEASLIEANTLEAIHKGKTGALITFAIWSGARLSGANAKQLSLLENFAQKLGYAFQIADDLLDSTGDLSTLGKTPGKDEAANKVTWVTVFGKEKATEKLKILEKEAMDTLENMPTKGKQLLPLKELLKYAIYRTK